MFQSSPEPPSLQNENSNDNQSSNGSLYKFKNYIRERFEHSNSDKMAVSSMLVCNTDVRTGSTDSMHLTSSIPEHCQSSSKPVPIFALHSKGSFYVPLTVDSHLLSPFVTELNCDDGNHGFSSLLLHPVTISVNFNRPVVHPVSPLLTPELGISSSIQSQPLLIMPQCR